MHRTALLGLALALGLAAPTAGDDYEIDPVHAVVMFRIKHLDVSYYYGRFNQVEGSFTWDADDPAASSIEVVIDAASIDTNDPRRDRHVKGPDFLSVEEFPKITFESKRWAPKEGAEGVYLVTGDLTLHGTTREVTVEATHSGEGDKGPRFGYRAGFECVFTVSRSDYGVSGLPDALGDEIRLHVALEGLRQ